MTDIYDLTEQLENAAFLTSTGYPVSTGDATAQTPFYVDRHGVLNFGYGIKIAKDGVTYSAGIAALSASTGGNIGSSNLALLNEYLAGSITLSQLNSDITSQDWRSTNRQAQTRRGAS